MVFAITGDGETKRSPYRTGGDLVDFFNGLGAHDTLPLPDTSRAKYVRRKILEANGTAQLTNVVEAAVHPAAFLATEFDVDALVDHLGQFLAFDDLLLRREGKVFRLRSTGSDLVRVGQLGQPTDDPLTHEFIREQLAKCEQKLGSNDLDGAVTNARSLLEAVLREIESRVRGESTDVKGDLGKQYKEVQRILHLEPDRKDIDGSLKQMLSGLVSVVNGIASARNAMSDAHARKYKPAPHHARLVVNAAQTLAEFLLAAYEAQHAKGMLDGQESS